MALNITDLKKGTIFQLDGVPYKVIDYSQKVMGRGGSIVNVRIKSLLDNKVLDRTFKGNEQFEVADITNQKVQFLYNDAMTAYFMNQDTFDQFEVPMTLVGQNKNFMKEGDIINLQLFGSKAINVELPKNVPLVVKHTETVVKGDTSSSITKDALLETGVTIKVPAFIKTGDTVSVDTVSGSYRERVKN
jgi:elongation factor P